MISTMKPEIHEESFVASRQALPASPFPRKYIHCVFDNMQDARQASLALFNAHYDAGDIHILTGREYVEAVERGQSLMAFLASHDLDTYLYESRRGHTILAVRIIRHEQLEQVRNLLAPHHAHLMKYIDTWTVSDLLP